MSTRAYRSAVRTEAPRATRAAIIEAARALFAERGYATTSVAAIAERAGVALNTVYTSVGGKPAPIEAVTRDATGDTAIEAVYGRRRRVRGRGRNPAAHRSRHRRGDP